MNLSGHGYRGVCTKRLCISFRCLIQAATPFARRCVWFIGLVGFEPTASWSRTRRDTKLRYSPKWNTYSGVRDRCATYFAYFSADSKEIESVVRGPVFKRSEFCAPESVSRIAFPLTNV